MRLFISACCFVVLASFAPASGFLIPEDKKISPLAMVHHKVVATIDDQVAITTVEQTFRNHTNRALEATYIFPIPKGASVNKFSMWVNGRETAGELLKAEHASRVYTDIVRRTQDPGLLEYIGNNLMRLRVFPVPAMGDQKIKISFTSIANQESGLVEYVYPLKTDGRATRTLEQFSVTVTVKSQHPVQSIYSPTHAIATKRVSDREVTVEFEKNQAMLDKDFQLFYGVSNHTIGLTPLFYKPITGDDGYFMALVSPQIEAAKAKRVPRDLVLVLDTSGSMSDQKMDQAKKALRYCLTNLAGDDRFGLVSFSTTVRNYKEELTSANAEEIERAKKWVTDLQAGGGTAILPALNAALAFKSKDAERTLTVVFFTDGMPTVDETNPDKIVKAIQAKNEANTRIFTFGVGDDVNAQMLDQLADTTRAVSTYVRPSEDLEVKVSSLHAKISHPVMTNLKLTTSNVRLTEMYPPNLPDLFHGQQLIVIGRYSGQGPAAITLAGQVGSEKKELVYELTFPQKTGEEKAFVEHLWARRKVGYMLDQIRANGQSKELLDEVIKLAKKFGIATPYTSYLVVPDGPMTMAAPGRFAEHNAMPRVHGERGVIDVGGGISGFGGMPAGGAKPPVTEAIRGIAPSPSSRPGEGIASGRGDSQNKAIDDALKQLPKDGKEKALEDTLKKAKEQNLQLEVAGKNYQDRNNDANRSGKLGVDIAEISNDLRSQTRMVQTASRQANGRNCVEFNGMWIDDQYTKQITLVIVKAQSDAYFRILEKQPKMKDVFRMSNRVVWVTPSGKALVVDYAEGAEQLKDDEIDALFVAKK